MWLSKYLKMQGLKPTHLARRAGVTPNTVTEFLNGKKGLTLQSAYLLSIVTNGMVRMEDLHAEQEFLLTGKLPSDV